MKNLKLLLISFMGIFMVSNLSASGYVPGDKAQSFRLKNVDGKMVGLDDYQDAKGFIVVFTCNTCPYAKAYEQRIMDLDRKFSDKGYPVIAINPNDPDVSPGDSYAEMQKRAIEKQYSFPYLFDETQEVFKAYGATRTPHVFVLNQENGTYKVAYIGAIDDNYKDASAAKKHYVEDAVQALMSGKTPNIGETKAIGCSIKVKK